LFKRCTIPVKAMATSMGKNSIKAGVRMVPKPKPEKKVRREATAATKAIIKYSIFFLDEELKIMNEKCATPSRLFNLTTRVMLNLIQHP
jgi:hypothetical protein